MGSNHDGEAHQAHINEDSCPQGRGRFNTRLEPMLVPMQCPLTGETRCLTTIADSQEKDKVMERFYVEINHYWDDTCLTMEGKEIDLEATLAA